MRAEIPTTCHIIQKRFLYENNELYSCEDIISQEKFINKVNYVLIPKYKSTFDEFFLI